MIETSEKYFNLMSALADSAMDMTDEEIQEEIAETGDTAEETRNLFLNAIEFATREAEPEEEIGLTVFERALLAVAEEEAAIDRLDRIGELVTLRSDS